MQTIYKNTAVAEGMTRRLCECLNTSKALPESYGLPSAMPKFRRYDVGNTGLELRAQAYRAGSAKCKVAE